MRSGKARDDAAALPESFCSQARPPAREGSASQPGGQGRLWRASSRDRGWDERVVPVLGQPGPVACRGRQEGRQTELGSPCRRLGRREQPEETQPLLLNRPCPTRTENSSRSL